MPAPAGSSRGPPVSLTAAVCSPGKQPRASRCSGQPGQGAGAPAGFSHFPWKWHLLGGPVPLPCSADADPRTEKEALKVQVKVTSCQYSGNAIRPRLRTEQPLPSAEGGRETTCWALTKFLPSPRDLAVIEEEPNPSTSRSHSRTAPGDGGQPPRACETHKASGCGPKMLGLKPSHLRTSAPTFTTPGNTRHMV